MCESSCARLAFKLVNIESTIPEEPGVYAFWFRNNCIYVGKTEQQTLKKRILDHWRDPQNPGLRLWLKAQRNKIDISFRVINNISQIKVYEKYYINYFQPRTNIIRYN